MNISLFFHKFVAQRPDFPWNSLALPGLPLSDRYDKKDGDHAVAGLNGKREKGLAILRKLSGHGNDSSTIHRKAKSVNHCVFIAQLNLLVAVDAAVGGDVMGRLCVSGVYDSNAWVSASFSNTRCVLVRVHNLPELVFSLPSMRSHR